MNAARTETGPEVLIVPTGAANVASVIAALSRAGAAARIAAEPKAIEKANLVVVPGVGSFGAAMEELRAHGADAALAARVKSGRPTLGICLGMQLMFEASDESPGAAGLGVLPGRIGRFAEPTGNGERWRVPQMGWNRVDAPDGGLIESGAAYLANSYRATRAPAEWSAAMSDHGGPFVAGMERGRVVLCQFHPELSGAWGLALIRRWIAAGLEAASC